MKNLLLIIIILLNFNISFGQNAKAELLKDYDFYTEKNIGKGKGWTKYYLSNGIVSVQENYLNKELRSRFEFKYDRYGNMISQIETYDINEGKVNEVLDHKPKYNDSLLISKEFNFGMTEKYSHFNEFGKPELIERNEQSEIQLYPFKEQIEYDDKGNIVKTIEFSNYEDLDEKLINEKATTHYKYDNLNNVIEIHREYEPKREFPIPITGGPFLYEYEYFRYKYNENGLWTKKYKTVNGKEYLVAKRKYK